MSETHKAKVNAAKCIGILDKKYLRWTQLSGEEKRFTDLEFNMKALKLTHAFVGFFKTFRKVIL